MSASEGSAGRPGEGDAGRHRVKKRVRVRVEKPVLLRQRVHTAWTHHRWWLLRILVVIAGLAIIWVALIMGVRD